MSILASASRLLPPPHYMQLPSVGVDVSDTSLKYIQFGRDIHGSRNLRLLHWGDIDIPDGALDGGVVHSVDGLTRAIREVRERTGCRYVRVSLPEERAYLFETRIRRGLSEKEIRGTLEFRLEENVPLAPQEALFDYDILHDTTDDGHVRVTVAAYARDTIMRYHEACVNAGVIPLSFEIEAQAIARATIPHDDRNAYAIVDFGKTRTGIGIVYGGSLVYTSTIDVGGMHLSNVIKKVLGPDVPESEVVRIKNQEGLVRGVDDASIYEALIGTVSVIKDDIDRRITYWNQQNNHDTDRSVQSVILCGGSANLKGLPGYLSETLGVPVQRASVWQNAFSIEDVVPPIGRRYSFGYATAIGLALNSFIA